MTRKKEGNMRIRKQRKEGEELRTIAVCVRLDPNEAARLDRRRGKIQRGTYIRLLLNNTMPPIIPEINADAYRKLNAASDALSSLANNTDADTLASVKATQDLIKQIRQILVQIYFTSRKNYESENQ